MCTTEGYSSSTKTKNARYLSVKPLQYVTEAVPHLDRRACLRNQPTLCRRSVDGGRLVLLDFHAIAGVLGLHHLQSACRGLDRDTSVTDELGYS